MIENAWTNETRLSYFQERKKIGQMEAIVYGREKEAEALLKFIQVYNYETFKVGMIVPDKFGLFAVSPDSLIKETRLKGFSP